MINYENANIKELWIHFVGNATQEEGIQFSNRSIPLHSEEIGTLVKKYFFDSFKVPEYYNFDFYDGNIEMNPLYNYAKMVFNDPEVLAEQSVNITKLLYNNSKHPNIKSGDLIIALVDDLLIEDELASGLCIFKSENKQAFINLIKSEKDYNIEGKEGINIGMLDKACIIINSDESEGYKICAIDHSNKSKDAQFWKEKFLNLKERSDDFHHTKHYIQATKAFVTERMKPLYEIDKTVEADIFNRTLNQLKSSEDFSQSSFDDAVFQDPNLVNDFQLFKLDFQQEKGIELSDNFKVSNSAIKNQNRVFKSVLKLDKNFHVYIHGNRNMIEKGTDPDGKKYYKLYYKEEN